MSVFNSKGINQSGNSCRGITLYSGGQEYIVYKCEHKPEDKYLAPASQDVKRNSITGSQILQNLCHNKNPHNLIDQLNEYVLGSAGGSSTTASENMIDQLANDLESGVLLISPIESISDKHNAVVENKKETPIILPAEGEVCTLDLPLEVQIIPLRYALDEFQLMLKPGQEQHSLVNDTTKYKGPHELPAQGRFSAGGYFSRKNTLSQNKYILRQLTNSWLYVYDEITKVLSEYIVKDGEFAINSYFNQSVSPEVLDAHIKSVSTLPFIQYKKESILYLMNSPIRWSKRLVNLFKAEPDRLTKIGRKVTCSTLVEDHTGLATEILESDSVADIGKATKALFPLAVPSIATRKAGEESIAGQPIKPIDGYLSFLPDKVTARVVALDDIWSDVNDMVSQIGYLSGLMYEYDEEEMAKRTTAQAIVAYCSGLEEAERLCDGIVARTK